MSDLLVRVAQVLCERERFSACICQGQDRTAEEMKLFVGCNGRLKTAALVLDEVQKTTKDGEAA